MTNMYKQWTKLAFLLHLAAQMIFSAHLVAAQDDINVQVKVYDTGLNPAPNETLIIDASSPLTSNEKGLAFITLPANAMPPKNIEVESEELEVESWNYSKGILEIIIRKKSYRDISISVIDLESRPLQSVEVKVSELQATEFNTDEDGKISLKLPLTTDLGKKDLFTISGFNIIQRRINNNNIIIVASEIVVKTVQDMAVATSKQSTPITSEDKDDDRLPNLNIETVDSIQSLTLMYTLMHTSR